MPTYIFNFIVGHGAEALVRKSYPSNDQARAGARIELEQRSGLSLLPASVSVGREDDDADTTEWLGAWDFEGGGAGEFIWEPAE